MLKSRPSQQKRLAAVLSKTLKDLEAREETDPNDTAFIQLKSHLVQRIIQLEVDSTRARATIHIVEQPDSGTEPSESEIDSATA